eukprot:COSAG01_NODE_3379_length_6171_cov_17.073287_4_plen_160_part_00
MRTLLEAGLEGQTWTRTVLLTPGMAASGIEVPLRRTAAAAAGGGATMMSVGDSASSSMMMSRSFSSPATLSSPRSVRSPARAASAGGGGEQQEAEAEAEAEVEEAEAEAEVRDSQLQEWLELSLRGELVEGIAEPAAEFRRGFLEVRAGMGLTIRRLGN